MRLPLTLLFATAALLGGLGLPLQAAEPPALLVTKAGFYYIVTDDAGVPVLVKVTKVISVGDTGGTPVPPDTPPPPQPPAVTQQVQAWAAEVNHPVGAQALAVVYSTVADSLKDGKIAPEDAFPAVKKATEQVLPLAGGVERWAGFRAKLGDLITLKLQKGELQHSKDYERFLQEVAAGLNGSAAEAPALNPEVVQKIIQLILFVLQIFAGGGDQSPI